MAKRKESGIEVVASLPWPLGVGLGFVAFVAIQYGIGWLWGASDNPYLSGFAKAAATGIYAPLAWFFLIACSVGALVSFLKRRRRRQLLSAQTGIDSLRSMDWRDFERLVGEAFRRQGYTVEETGLGGRCCRIAHRPSFTHPSQKAGDKPSDPPPACFALESR